MPTARPPRSARAAAPSLEVTWEDETRRFDAPFEIGRGEAAPCGSAAPRA